MCGPIRDFYIYKTSVYLVRGTCKGLLSRVVKVLDETDLINHTVHTCAFKKPRKYSYQFNSNGIVDCIRFILNNVTEYLHYVLMLLTKAF